MCNLPKSLLSKDIITHSLIPNLVECWYSFIMPVVYVLLVYILIKALMPFSGHLFRLVWIFVPQRCQSFQMVSSFNLFIILMRGIPSLRAELALTIPFSYLNAELWLKYTPGVRAIELCIPCSQDWLLVLIHQLHLQCLTSWYLFTATRQGGRIAAQKKVVSAVFGGLRVLRINGFFSTMLCSKINLVSACHELTQIVVIWLFKAQNLPSTIRLSPALPL